MVYKTIVLFSLFLLISCGGSSSNESDNILVNDEVESSEPSLSKVFIFKEDTQCNDDGLTIDETAAYLTSSNIEIVESECGIVDNGLSIISVCGADTQNIFIHTINTSDLPVAENLGFTDTEILPSQDATFQVNECS